MKDCFFYSVFQEVYDYHKLLTGPDETPQKVSHTILIKVINMSYMSLKIFMNLS